MKNSLAKWAVIAICMCVTLSGCVTLHSSSISGRSGGCQSTKVTAGDYGILHLTTPDNLTEAANSQLVSQCPGKLTNVQTELSMREWIVVQWYTVSSTAVCQ